MLDGENRAAVNVSWVETQFVSLISTSLSSLILLLLIINLVLLTSTNLPLSFSLSSSPPPSQISVGENLSAQLSPLLYKSSPSDLPTLSPSDLPTLTIVLATTIPFTCILLCCAGWILAIICYFKKKKDKRFYDIELQHQEKQISFKNGKLWLSRTSYIRLSLII